MTRPLVPLIAVALLFTAACGEDSPAVAPTPALSAAPSAAPPSASPPSASPSSAPALADGRHPVFLSELDTAGRTVRFDLIKLLSGDEAKAEWEKENPGDQSGPPNDYLLVNDNPLLRTLPVAAKVKVIWLDPESGVDPTPGTWEQLPAHLEEMGAAIGETDDPIGIHPFWLTVVGGEVTQMEEQYLP